MISNAQIRLLQAARKQLDIPEDDWRALLRRHGSKTGSCKELDNLRFDMLLATLSSMGFTNTSRHRPIGSGSISRSARGMASAAQLATMLKLWDEFTDGRGTEITLGKFLEGRFGISSARFVTSADAKDRIIGCLRTMVARKARRTPSAATEPPPVAS
jgi:hypothetical protein